MNISKPIQIFRPGTHTAMSGAVLGFSESDLAASAQAYDPAKHEAPLVVGHPQHDAPAYGWVRSLGFADGSMEAQPDQVDPAFAEMVAAGRFKKISASFYSPDSPNNPVPGVYYLRHVGFLGAQPPAVKGLRAPEFADNEEGIVEFADWSDMQNAGLWRSLRDWIIGRFGLDEADKVISGYAVASLEADAQQDTSDDPMPAPAFTEPVNPQKEIQVTPEQAAALEAENAQMKTRLAGFEASEKQVKTTAIHTGNAAFTEALVQDGKLLPVNKDVAIAILDHFAGQDAPVEFGEGDAKQPMVDAFKAFLQAQPKVVVFGEYAVGEIKLVDMEDATAIHDKAVEFMEAEARAGREINIAQAVAHVTQANQ
ncbi:MAG: hypothetical protein ACYCY1_12440 [Sulfuriferula sp.]